MRHLGIIIPGRREDGSTTAGRREIYKLGSVLDLCAITNVRVHNALSTSDGAHGMESVWRTASPEALDPAAAELKEAGCEALAWACTCGSFIGGREWSEAQARQLTAVTGVPATSTSLAIAAAVQNLEVSSVAVLASYPEELSHRFACFLNEFGIRVRALVSLGCADAEFSNSFDMLSAGRALLNAVSPSGLALVIPDTAVDGVTLQERLKGVCGIPIVTANAATLWHGLRCLNEVGDFEPFVARAAAKPISVSPSHSKQARSAREFNNAG